MRIQLALLLILAHPKLLNCAGMLIRDIGYWAFLMASCCCLMRLVRDHRRGWLLLWAALVGSAAAFKPEAIVWGLLVAIGLLFVPDRGPWRR